MNKAEKMFHQCIITVPNANEGKIFGAKCIKSVDGKTAAFFWQECMVFKLDKNEQLEALELRGASIGKHLYAPDKPMKGWISIPKEHSDKWLHFTSKSLDFVESL
jgi:hypothetical protein